MAEKRKLLYIRIGAWLGKEEGHFWAEEAPFCRKYLKMGTEVFRTGNSYRSEKKIY